jgi:hypothetical protein
MVFNRSGGGTVAVVRFHGFVFRQGKQSKGAKGKDSRVGARRAVFVGEGTERAEQGR